MNRQWTWLLVVAALTAGGCGGDSPTEPDRQTLSVSGSLDDPTRCTCGNGINTYTVEPTKSGAIEAVATVSPADARLVVRLLDSSFNTVYVVSSQTGNTARFTYNGTPATYRVQVFLASDGPRQATFNLTLTYP